MARNITALTIFLASPSDVAHERQVVGDAIQEWNSRHGRSLNVLFELLKWETSVSAGFDTDGQAVINSQIPDNYDLMIAIFWARLGSPTPRASSGTVEEYQRAFLRFKNGDELDIAFFFKDALIDFRALDLSQIEAVKNFEKEVQKAGALTKSFKGDDALRLEVSILLDRVAKKFTSSGQMDHDDIRKHSTAVVTVDRYIAKNDLDDDDIGLFDIVDKMQDHASKAGAFLTTLTDNIVNVGSVASAVTEKFSAITSVRPLEIEESKPGIKLIAEAMESFSNFLEEETPEYAENLMAMANNVRDMIRVSYDWIDANDALLTMTSLRAMLIEMHKGISANQKSFAGYLDETTKLQRTTSQFNKARRRIINAGNTLIDTNENGKSLIEQALDELGKLILLTETRSTDQKVDGPTDVN